MWHLWWKISCKDEHREPHMIYTWGALSTSSPHPLFQSPNLDSYHVLTSMNGQSYIFIKQLWILLSARGILRSQQVFRQIWERQIRFWDQQIRISFKSWISQLAISRNWKSLFFGIIYQIFQSLTVYPQIVYIFGSLESSIIFTF